MFTPSVLHRGGQAGGLAGIAKQVDHRADLFMREKELLESCERAVGAAVVDGDDLDVPPGLDDRVDEPSDELVDALFLVVAAHQNGKRGLAQGVTSFNVSPMMLQIASTSSSDIESYIGKLTARRLASSVTGSEVALAAKNGC